MSTVRIPLLGSERDRASLTMGGVLHRSAAISSPGCCLYRLHTVLFFKIYAVEIGHQFRARGIIRIGQDYISSEYEQVPTSSFGEKSKKPLFYYKKCS